MKSISGHVLLLILPLLLTSGCQRCSDNERRDARPSVEGTAAPSASLPLIEGDFGTIDSSEVIEMVGLMKPDLVSRMVVDERHADHLLEFMIGYRVLIEDAAGEAPTLRNVPDLVYASLLSEQEASRSMERLEREALSESRLKAYYDSHLGQFTPDTPRKRVSLIPFEANEAGMSLAQQTLKDLQAGRMTFEEASDRFSIEPRLREKRGEFGWWEEPMGKRPKSSLDQIIKGIVQPGLAPKAFYTEGAVWLVRLDETAEARPAAFEDVRQKIADGLRKMEMKDYYLKGLEEACARAGIEVNREALRVTDPSAFPDDPLTVMSKDGKGNRVTWEDLTRRMIVPPNAMNLMLWIGTATAVLNLPCLEQSLAAEEIQSLRRKADWVAGFRRAGPRLLSEVEARYPQLPQTVEELEAYYQENLSKFAIRDEATGESHVPSFEAVSANVSKAVYQDYVDRFTMEILESTRERHNVKINEAARIAALEKLIQQYRNSAIKAEDGLWMSLAHSVK